MVGRKYESTSEMSQRKICRFFAHYESSLETSSHKGKPKPLIHMQAEKDRHVSNANFQVPESRSPETTGAGQ